MYTNSFIKEQMEQQQPCNREDIGLHLEVAAGGIDKANCPEFKGLQNALKELSELLKKADSQNDSESASQIVNAAPASAPASAPALAPAAQNAYIMDTEIIHYNGASTSTSYEKIKQMLENTILKQTIEERKDKIKELLDKIKEAEAAVEVQNIMNGFGNFEIKGNGAKQYYTIGINGGTRKRRMRRVKTQRRRKNARTIKKKITNNKSGKRN